MAGNNVTVAVFMSLTLDIINVQEMPFSKC